MYAVKVLPDRTPLEANEAFIRMIQGIMGQGGGARKNIRRMPTKKNKSVRNVKWMSTGRQITTKCGSKKTIYTNPATGEQRVRQMVVDKKTGVKSARYVKM